MCMHINNMQLITDETKKHPLYILWRSRGLWILENSVSLSGILWWFRPGVSINRNAQIVLKVSLHRQDINYFCRIQERMPCSTPAPKPARTSLLVWLNGSCAKEIPCGIWPMFGIRCCWMFSRPRSMEHSRFPAELAARFAVQKDSEGKKKKMSQIALLKTLVSMICLGAVHRTKDYFGLKGALKST